MIQKILESKSYDNDEIKYCYQSSPEKITQCVLKVVACMQSPGNFKFVVNVALLMLKIFE